MNFKQLLLISAGILIATSVFGQPPNGGPPNGSPTCWPPPCVPIDGGITLLIAGGAAFGAKKLYNARKKAVALPDKQ